MAESVPPPASRSSAPVRTIALMNQKGGVGKTTTTVNLAAGIAQLGRRVLVVDLDPQAHATLHLGVTPGEPETSVYDLFHDPNIPAEEAMIEVRPNLCLIPAETDLAATETELASGGGGTGDRRTRLATSLQGLLTRAAAAGKPFDAVLLDCPPSLGRSTRCARPARCSSRCRRTSWRSRG
jgi:chromosome partitioning protein